MTVTSRVRFLDDFPIINHTKEITSALTNTGRRSIAVREGPLMSKIAVVEVLAPSSVEIHRMSVERNVAEFKANTRLCILDTLEIQVPWLDENAFDMKVVANGIANFVNENLDRNWPVVVWEHWRFDVDQTIRKVENDDSGNPVVTNRQGSTLRFYVSGHIVEKISQDVS